MVTKRSSIVLVAAIVLAAAWVGGCSQQGPASEPAQEEVQTNTQEQQQRIDSAVASAQATVSEVTSDAARPEVQEAGLEINERLGRIGEELADASAASGDAKVDAVKKVSQSMTDFIDDIDEAAAVVPEGSVRQAALTRISGKLKTAQQTLAAAIEGL